MEELQQAQKRRRRNTRVIPIVVIGVLLVVGLAYLTTRSHGKSKASTSTSTTAAGASTTTGSTTPTTASVTAPTAAPVTGAAKLTSATPCPNFNGSSPHTTTFSGPPPYCLQAGKTYTGVMQTTEGNIGLSFDTTKTPKTANNFIVLSLYHYYDGTAMFRTDTSIGIIQGGSPHTQSASDPGPGYTIKDEGTGFKYTAGDLVMARTSAANSAGAQYFFCVTAACSNLNSAGTYVTFAHVTSGLDVLQKILALNVDLSNGLGGAPKTLVTVKTITIAES
jgi:peptidyl-prolyl cis-trans isomerase B (cyclophilin B)